MNVLEAMAQLGEWGKAHPMYALGMAGLPALVGLATLPFRTKRAPSTSHGSARWATAREIQAAGLTAPHGVVLGRLGRQILHDDSETHVLLVAATRSGKGVGPILCTLLSWQHSALIYDPKDGENYDASAPWRRMQGHQVEQFTPRRSPHACINVEDLIRRGTLQEFDDAWTIAASLTAPAEMRHETPVSVHFRRLATMLLTAAQLHMAYAEPPASLAKLWWMLTQRYHGLLECLEAMQTTDHTAHGVHRAITELATAIRNISNERELGSVWSTAISPLLPYADPLTQRSTDTSTIALDELQYGKRPLSLYLVAPKPSALDRLHPIYRVVSDMALQRLQEHTPRTATHRLLVIADESPSYGYSTTLDKGAAETAGYGIKLLIVAQDIPQLEDTFGANNSIWGNTQTKIFFAPDSDVTAKRLSDNFLGHATVEQPVLSQQQGMQKRAQVSYQQVGRPLMTADELRAMHLQAAIIYRTGLRPILCGKVNCRTDKEYRERYNSRAA